MNAKVAESSLTGKDFEGGIRMVTKEELYYDSRDGISKIHAIRWIPKEEPKAVLQIVHGMAEYVDRYHDFAVKMAEKGFLVVGEDHLGHGLSVQGDGAYGYFCENDPATVVVRDVHRLKKLTQQKYPGLPYFIMGHSMGSFITRNYLCKYGTGIDGAIIMGTGMQKKALVSSAKKMAAIQKVLHGSRYVSKVLDKAAFGQYNKMIANPLTESDWLSKDEKKVEAYINDPLCGFTFTVNGFQTLFELIWRLYQQENLDNMPKELPVMFASGTDDPVGDYFEGVERAVESFRKTGMLDITVKKYEKGRHELLNEPEWEQVAEDIYGWLSEKIAALEAADEK